MARQANSREILTHRPKEPLNALTCLKESTRHHTESYLTGPEICKGFVPIMADRSLKYLDNAPGKYYVDSSCIDCDLCRETAPTMFARNEDGSYSYVSKQPATDEEIQLMSMAMDGCPVEAVGDDGDQ